MIACTVGRVYCLQFKGHTENTEITDILTHTDLTDLTEMLVYCLQLTAYLTITKTITTTGLRLKRVMTINYSLIIR